MLTSPNDLLALPQRCLPAARSGGSGMSGVGGPAKATIVRSLQKEGKYGTFPGMGENKKEAFISRGMR